MTGFKKESYLRQLEELVNMDSGSNDAVGIRRMAEHLAGVYRDAGFHVTLEERGPGKRPLVTAATKDLSKITDCEKPVDILFIGHYDTVFPAGTAAERPYRTDEKYAYGPGVADMKSGILLALHLAKSLRKLHPEISVAILNNGDEEIGSNDSKAYIVEFSKKARWAFDLEPGRANGNFVKRRKGGYDCRVTFHGRAGHAAYPESGKSAIIEAANWVIDTAKLCDAERGISVNVGIIGGGTSSNVIPDRCELLMEFRFWKHDQGDEVLSALRDRAAHPTLEGVTIDFEIESEISPMEEADGSADMIAALSAECQRLGRDYGFESSPGASDASLVSLAGTPIIDACGPCGDFLHSDREQMELATIGERFEMIFNAIEKLLGYK